MDLQSKIPGFITEKGNIIRLVIFTASFALLFVNFYSPFGVRYWFNVTQLQLLVYSSLVILTGVLVVVFSRWLMFVLSKYFTLTYWQFFAWVAAEVFLMALFYAIFEKIYFDDERQFGHLLKTSMQNTALVLLLPYSAMWLYFSYREKKHQLEQMAMGNPLPDHTKNMIPFHDEKGILRLSVKKENLLYLESSDNYVNIYYQHKEKISKFLLRNTMKKMEELFQNSEIIRCHRSYMVNFEKVKIIRKDKEGLQLELDLQSAIDIPVSRSYIEKVMNTFSRYSSNY
ncbi:MAG TPA: LytTR family DNA-binding domain-containing protein [Bacteroidales bacterium]|nr:LytTR family DNA-binding domain-containing protein [Bacteroidales bacterium]